MGLAMGSQAAGVDRTSHMVGTSEGLRASFGPGLGEGQKAT